MAVSEPVVTMEEVVVWEWEREWEWVLVVVMVCLVWVVEGIEIRMRAKNGFKGVFRFSGGVVESSI